MKRLSTSRAAAAVQALPEFEKIATLNPGDPETPKMLAHLYHEQEQPRKAMEVLEKHLREQQLSTDFTHANMLAELYMEDRQFEKAFQLIRNTITLYCPGDAAIPLDLQVRSHRARPALFSRPAMGHPFYTDPARPALLSFCSF